jgi:hypothetical protein
VQEGGNSTKYFHHITNRKHTRENIFQFEKEEGQLLRRKNINFISQNAIKKLYGAPTQNNFSMRETEI